MDNLSARRWIKDFSKRLYLRAYKGILHCGWHVVPDHYYVSLPNILELKRTKPIWARRSELPGISYDICEFERTLRRWCDPYRDEYADLPAWRRAMSCGAGPGYGYIESQCLHAVVRSLTPRNVIEVGSGVSTAILLDALARNGSASQVTCIEPYPSPWLVRNKGVRLIRERVQASDIGIFKELGKNDLLFIDSTHTVKPGSDVNYLILEVLPRLNPGVVVHFHDIYLPYDYSRDVLNTFLHWSETSLLRAFLIDNSRARIMLSLSMMHYDRPDVLRDVFPAYVPEPHENGMARGSAKPMESSIKEHFPCSTYIEVL